jgi:arylformamidase
VRSAKLATGFQDTLDLRYGPHPRETLDYFSCGKRNAPLFVFIHGGYWQMRNKEMFRFVASGPLAHGFDVANIGYPLAPDRDMRGIIASLRSAFSYLRLHNSELGFDASHIYVSGWSAGAHLAVNMLEERGVCGALAISGIYDLEPISKSYLNDKLQLTESEILLFSPLRKPFVKKSVVVVVGADELPELRRHSIEFAMRRAGDGISGSFNLLSNQNHFTILEELEDPEGSLTQLLVQLTKCKRK